MADHIVSVDAGNGGTNAVISAKGKFKSTFFPSVRATATGDSLGLDAGMEMQVDYVDWNGHRYVVGDDAIQVSRRSIERHQGAGRYGDELHQFLVAVALAQLGVKDGKVDLTLFAPPGLYIEARVRMQRFFMEKDGLTAIKLKADKKPRVWHYENITVYPEGIGAAACFALDETGKPVQSDVLNGETVILDMGVYTLDALKLQDGSFNPESLESATWEAGGLRNNILDPILRVLKKQGEDFSLLTTDDVDFIIRQGLLKGDWCLRRAGMEVSIQPLVDKYAERYAEWIANQIISSVFSDLRGIKSLILVGGGTPLIEQHLRKWYGDKVLNPEKHKATKGLAAVDMNAVGGMRLTLARLQK